MQKTYLILWIVLVLCLTLFFILPKQKTSTVRILAASSLICPLDKLKNDLKSSSISIDVNYAGTQELYSQVINGVKADLFLSANKEYVDKLYQQKLLNKPLFFAKNKIILIFNKQNIQLNSIYDLKYKKLRLLIAHPSVPIGLYTKNILENISKKDQQMSSFKQNVLSQVISYELNVKSILSKVVLGDADAGFIYYSDYISLQDKSSVGYIVIPEDVNVYPLYYGGILTTSSQSSVVQEVFTALQKESFEKILLNCGFSL